MAPGPSSEQPEPLGGREPWAPNPRRSGKDVSGPRYPARGAVTYLLRNAQQELVALSNQADVKASIVITASAIVLGLAVNNIGDHSLRWSLVTLAVWLLVSMFLAIVAVIPKHRRGNLNDHERGTTAFNPLFFGHYSTVPEETFVTLMEEIMVDDETVYQAQLRDLHARGVYIERNKLRYLRWSYAAFFVAFLAGSVQQLITVIVR
jgi:hypothetical protein